MKKTRQDVNGPNTLKIKLTALTSRWCGRSTFDNAGSTTTCTGCLSL